MPERKGAAVLVVAIAAALAALLQHEGQRARRFRPGHLAVEVRDGAGTLAAWHPSGVHGRAILWLARGPAPGTISRTPAETPHSLARTP
jgi:hypothetical protein